ncbi:RNA-binding protein 44 isoform X2 [Oryzias latipes]|uniref:RNA-binding protein 44 isoform X2 n=1 Tax=Oryzias latipes TaxID=8090 RepID=UPI0009DA9B91|nr:RNA-binding protein 44 isoform X2 [Oryzias latipes]
MAGFQAAWSGYPAAMAVWASAVPPIPVTHELMLIPQALPPLYLPPKTEDRVVDLQRSVLNLVESFDHLALTDQELLRWYLSLCLEDRKIIHDKGGLYQFLLSHPGLNHYQDLVFVKYGRQNSSRAVTSSLYRTAGRRGSCECWDGAPCVLALHCTMCPQHSWRLFYTSADGSQILTTPQDPAAHILHALHRLDSDYNHMKQQILAGVPLEHLYRPSAVSAAAHCVPVQGISDGPPRASSWACRSPQDPQKLLEAAEAECEDDCSSQVIERTVEAEDPGRRADAPESCPRGGRLVDRQMEICQEVSESQLSGAPTGEQADGAKTPQLLQEGCSADLNSLGTESTGGESGAVLFVSNLSKEASQPRSPPRADVFMSLDGKQTFVPQTWGTMGSICALTAQLRRLHPEASRASIMAALKGLRATQKGPLCSLSLESVQDMTSDLLSRQDKD